METRTYDFSARATWLYICVIFRAHDNSRIVCAGADKVVLMIDVGTGQPIRRLRGHTSVSYE